MSYTNSALATGSHPAAANDESEALRDLYLESLQLVERLHRRLLDVIKDEFDRANRTDINAVQALLLFNIGNSEQLEVGEAEGREQAPEWHLRALEALETLRKRGPCRIEIAAGHGLCCLGEQGTADTARVAG